MQSVFKNRYTSDGTLKPTIENSSLPSYHWYIAELTTQKERINTLLVKLRNVEGVLHAVQELPMKILPDQAQVPNDSDYT